MTIPAALNLIAELAYPGRNVQVSIQAADGEDSDQIAETASVAALRAQAGTNGLTVLFVPPDDDAGRPEPCMRGWGRLALVVDPTGLILRCHETADLRGLELWRVSLLP